MHLRFLLGPSGTGKTFRCLAEARACLMESPEGPPLLFLAPKQATYQLERQLLASGADAAGGGLAGFTRLQILSFDRLANFVLEEFGSAVPRLLSENGRIMVLRSLLTRPPRGLKVFHAAARLRGFAQELGGVLREFQRARITPQALADAAARADGADAFAARLHDLAVLYEAYLARLERHGLEDQDRLLTLAAEVVNGVAAESAVRIGGLWLDGFAEMSEQEIELLTALLPFCDRATLAFNLDRESLGQTSWLATWSNNAQTYRRLHARIAGRTGIAHDIEWLDRAEAGQRFERSAWLRHLERHWGAPVPLLPRPPDILSSLSESEERAGRESSELLCALNARIVAAGVSPAATSGSRGGEHVAQGSQSAADFGMPAVRVASCANPEAEAMFAAREILRFARAGGRFREAAVLVRNLEHYHEVIRRAFEALEIPFFLDRREPVGHHPLAELTRSALRLAALRWPAEEWFGALKTGLVHEEMEEIDWLENEALARGWKGEFWRRPASIPGEPELEQRLERLRGRWVPPFERLIAALGTEPSGTELAEGLRKFYGELGIAAQLDRWSEESGSALHRTFRDQMEKWLEDIALAFGGERIPLREWLPVIDAGLAAQTVGVIPPSLDQVLVGAVDRSRNPDLRLVILLGMNESVFPAPPATSSLLPDADRERLLELGLRAGSGVKDRLGQERYLAYVACTRSRERLVITHALRDHEDQPLNPSPFLSHVRRLLPEIEMEKPVFPPPPEEVEHAVELIPRLLQALSGPGPVPDAIEPLLGLPAFSGLRAELERFRAAGSAGGLSPGLAERLYGERLQTSVSRIEEFAACPFRFFVSSGLRAEERKFFELDAREKGSFQHEVLALFHQRLSAEGKRWRDITPTEARGRIAEAAASLAPGYGNGLLVADDRSLFTAKSMTASLQDFIETIIGWMSQYEFDPGAVELAFGQADDPLPPWKLRLGPGRELWFRGKIDRVDLCRLEDGTALCVVIDYKSSAKKLDPALLAHGLQLQLAGYLTVLRGLPEAAAFFGVKELIPAGAFYASLRGAAGSEKTREEALASPDEARKRACRHSGRFDAAWLRKLDRRDVKSGDQFSYSINKDGSLGKKSKEALDAEAFRALVDSVELSLVRMGNAIYAGEAGVLPFKKGNSTACDSCRYQAACRIDPWTHPFRALESGPEATEA